MIDDELAAIGVFAESLVRIQRLTVIEIGQDVDGHGYPFNNVMKGDAA